MEALHFFNKLYQKGLLDPDSMTQTYENMMAKTTNGNVFFSIFDYAGSQLFNTQKHVDENKFMAPLVPTDASVIVYGLSEAATTASGTSAPIPCIPKNVCRLSTGSIPPRAP